MNLRNKVESYIVNEIYNNRLIIRKYNKILEHISEEANRTRNSIRKKNKQSDIEFKARIQNKKIKREIKIKNYVFLWKNLKYNCK